MSSIGSRDVADRILSHAARAWFTHYPVVAWSTPADMVRSEKYLKTRG